MRNFAVCGEGFWCIIAIFGIRLYQCRPLFVLSQTDFHFVSILAFCRNFMYVGGSERWMSICDFGVAFFASVSAGSLP